ncbi:DUF4202 domain-containing protein [Exilibacterium tricleocarpae]|uniref:DUF4202 domain-containing protein n=1 Tax=Exilibacterium tricleocarpae TaxID=2591008 RepID=A0A545SS17_9GAMM|nr:DUF4202 domain-containing protein [Exilibacterium tricleocarpae]TQV67763.1 DUF4202 domain-containing protein [Exilibacterium tricleocarpae]
METQAAFTAVIQQIDQANQQDPNTELHQGRDVPRELLYSQRMTARLATFAPEASDLVRIAVHAQHIQRWKIPRQDYPLGRAGYKRWRTDLARFHAATTGDIMAAAGYDTDAIEQVKTLLQKKQLKRNAQVQLLEDVVCLVFLEHYLADFAKKHSPEKLVDIIKKTWHKMSERGHQAALQLPLSAHLSALIDKALA